MAERSESNSDSDFNNEDEYQAWADSPERKNLEDDLPELTNSDSDDSDDEDVEAGPIPAIDKCFYCKRGPCEVSLCICNIAFGM
jgi:hypothetical protein